MMQSMGAIPTLFLSTLSLRRATWLRCWQLAARDISIHALLAESDTWQRGSRITYVISIHALLAESDPCGGPTGRPAGVFLSTLSLRRATETAQNRVSENQISIHALLAESDAIQNAKIHKHNDFYPRSPCGERRQLDTRCFQFIFISIHALLAESDSLRSAY